LVRLSSPDFILPLLLSLAVLVASLSVHEAAHAWTADRLGDSTARQLGRLTLNPLAHLDWIGTVLFPLVAMSTGLPLIGWAKPVPVLWRNLRHPRRDFALVALAGPVSNLLLAAVAAAILVPLEHLVGFGPGLGSTVAIGLATAVSLNVLLAVFNLIPVPPLDGGNVLAGIVPEAAARVVDLLRPYGFLILYGLLLTGVFGAIVRPVQAYILGWLL
jgi:Zn-dependent protease